MGYYRFETEIMVKQTKEYIIKADSMEEALDELQTGIHRDRYMDIIANEPDWASEIIVVEEELEEEDN